MRAAHRGLLESETYKRCVAAYNSAGGDKGLMSLAPSCAASDMSKFDFNKCCSEATPRACSCSHLADCAHAMSAV